MAYVKPPTNRLIARMVPTTMGDAASDSGGLDVHGCTPDQVWNGSACIGIDQNLKDINAAIAAQTKAAGSIVPGVSDQTLLIGVGVLAALFLFKKKRRS